MADDSTLLAHLVPRLTIQVENAATDALAYILNRSPGAMGVLNGLLREGGFGIESIARVETQVAYGDLCRPDMAGYDRSGATRLLVESKFWATLGEGQSCEYSRHLDESSPSSPAALLFIAPEGNILTLWAQIAREMEECCKGLEPIDSPQGTMKTRVIDPERPERRLMLVSWVALLNRMLPQAGDEGVASDIRQLRGLAQGAGHAFVPAAPRRRDEPQPRAASSRLVQPTRRPCGRFQRSPRRMDGAFGGLEGARSQRYGYGRYYLLRGRGRGPLARRQPRAVGQKWRNSAVAQHLLTTTGTAMDESWR